MSKKMIFIAGAMTLAALSVAQDAPFGPAQGVKTLGVNGSYSNMSGGGATVKIFNLQLNGSYFFTNSIEGFLGIGYQKAEAGGGSVTSDFLSLGANYYFGGNRELTMENPWAPFAGLFFTTNKITGADRINGLGAQIGAHYFLQPNVALTPVLSFSRARVTGVDVDTTQLGFGLTVFFK
jgi:hypothetical protein